MNLFILVVVFLCGVICDPNVSSEYKVFQVDKSMKLDRNVTYFHISIHIISGAGDSCKIIQVC